MRRSKEEGKIEKTIRGLLKLPENRRCLNCKTLGPQYVCPTFWTFVCTNCSGVHREFSHRVKSISMAKFTLEEVNALQAGGNERAKQIYFKTWDTQRNSFPDNSNIHKLRDFIKHVYVERRYTGETHTALSPRPRNIDDEEAYERRSRDANEKPSFHERSLDRYGRFSFKEPKSFGYDRENSSRSYGGFRSSSSRLGGRYQVDGARIAGRSATDMFTTADIKPNPREKSPDPPVHHVREILGDNCPRLRVGDQPKLSERRNFYGSANNVQKVVQSSNETSANKENAEVKLNNGSAGSLVNFANFPPPEVCLKQEQGTHVTNDGRNSSSSQNPASSKPPPVEDTTRNTPAKNTLEYLLFELASPVSTPSNNHSAVIAIEEAKESPTPTPTLRQPPEHSVITVLDGAISPTPSSHSNGVTYNQAEALSIVPSVAVPKQENLLPQRQAEALSIVPSVAVPEQENLLPQRHAEALSKVPSVVVPKRENLLPQRQDAAATAEPSTTETRSSGRTELPVDLFSSFNPRGARPGWQIVPSHGMGFDMQYRPSSMPIPAFQNVTKSRNPFDTDDNTTQHYATNTLLPSMASLQGGLPNVSSLQEISHTSTFGSSPHAFVPTHSSSLPSGAYMGHQLFSSMSPTRLQGTSAYGSQEIPAPSNSNQQTQYTYPTNTSVNFFPKNGGNPFG